MTPTEQRYSAFDRELLAVYLAIRNFRHFLEGRQFHVLTDHKPLTYALGTRLDRHSPRQALQLDCIYQLTSSVRHVHEHDNVVADALSRIESNSLLLGQPPVVVFTAMAQAKSTDFQIQALQSSPSSSLIVEAIPCLTPRVHSTATRLPDFSALWCPGNGDALCFILCTEFFILASEQLRSLLHLGLYSLASMLMFSDGPAFVSSVNVPKFSATSALHLLFPFLTLLLTSRASTWLDHFHHHEDSRIFSLVLIALPDGQKLFPLPPRRPTSLFALSSVNGYLALVSRPLLLQTVVGNLNHTCGAT